MSKNSKVVADGQATETEKKVTQETGNKPDVAADVQEMSKEQIEFARINIRKTFNEKFSKWAEIDPVDADDDFEEFSPTE